MEIQRTMKTEKHYISEKIGNQYTEWKNEGVIIASGTDTGKTTFICNTLIPYAYDTGKNVLYLVNRKSLYEQIKNRIKHYPHVQLMTYQALQSFIRKGMLITHYDYIIADECHYFLTDGLFNQYTDISYKWLIEQKNNVVVYMSATGNQLFSGLRLSGLVMPNRIYYIENDYSQVEAVYFYNKNQITNVIDNILNRNPEDKILVFVNSIKRLKELHCIYGDTASYLCSQFHMKDESLSFIDYKCVKDYSYSKRILFVTKTMDNGIDLKDKRIKHVFSEIIDIDSAMQAIGRKRPVSNDDRYSIYFLRYSNRAIRQFAKIEESDLLPVQKLMYDKESFLQEYKADRELLRKNKILYGEMDEGDVLGTVHINHIVRRKFEQDVAIYNTMIADGYEKVFLKFLGKAFQAKTKELIIDIEEKDKFLEYLISVCDKKLFKEEQKELKNKFRILLGLKDRYMGINTLNGKLKDCRYPYMIVSLRETQGENKFKRYWHIQQYQMESDCHLAVESVV